MRDRVDTVFADARIQQAFRFISANESQIEADQIRLTEIPAPPLAETERARAFSEELLKLRLSPFTDDIGNVIAAYEGMGHDPVIAGAHLDTVFPASTPLQLRRKGRVLFLPGISDNGCGIVALLWAFRAAKETGILLLFLPSQLFFRVFRPGIACQAPKPSKCLKQKKIDLAC